MAIKDFRPIKKGDKKTIRGWLAYDWANSVFNLTISSAVFPAYYTAITQINGTDKVNFFGFEIINTVLYSWTLSAAYLLVAIFSPYLAALADYTGRRKLFMKIFAWMGAVSCGLLYFFNSQRIEFGILAFGFATIGYGASLVYYNSFLPLIAEPKDQDMISAKGFSMGYAGAIVLLLINIITIQFHKKIGIPDAMEAQRIAFVSVFLWWFGFSFVTFTRLPKYTFGERKKGENIWKKGYTELIDVFKIAKKTPLLLSFLFGYFFMFMGVQTVMSMATPFASKELNIQIMILIVIILCIQFLGIAGAYLFAFVSKKIGNFKALTTGIFLWIIIILSVYLVQTTGQFIIIACCVGLIMGGSQSLARSTYSKLLPETKKHSSFFSFFDVMEKLATVLGTLSFGLIENFTGSMRNAVFAISGFFFISLLIHLRLVYNSRRSNV